MGLRHQCMMAVSREAGSRDGSISLDLQCLQQSPAGGKRALVEDVRRRGYWPELGIGTTSPMSGWAAIRRPISYFCQGTQIRRKTIRLVECRGSLQAVLTFRKELFLISLAHEDHLSQD